MSTYHIDTGSTEEERMPEDRDVFADLIGRKIVSVGGVVRDRYGFSGYQVRLDDGTVLNVTAPTFSHESETKAEGGYYYAGGQEDN